MLMPIAYNSYQISSEYVIDISMILHTVFTMFVDLKTGCHIKYRYNIVKKDTRIPAL